MIFLEPEDSIPKKKRIPIGIYIFLFFLLCLLMFVISHIGKIFLAYQKQDAVYEDYKEQIVVSDTEKRQVSMDALKKVSPSSVSWIYIPGTRVDYPMVQGKDNFEFLKKDAYGNASDAGAIFLNSFNSPDMTDTKSIIFGHNMKNGSMFHDIRSYAKEKFAIEHPELYLYMQDGTARIYRFVCTFETTAQDDVVYTCNSTQSSQEAIAPLLLKASSTYEQPNDMPFILLSTCIKDDRRCICLFQQTGAESK